MAIISNTLSRNVIEQTGSRREQVRPVHLLWAGPFTAVVATIATTAVREVGVAIGTVPADLRILQEPAVATSTIALLLLGSIVFAVLAHLAEHPAHTFRLVAVVALVHSFANPIAAGAGWMPSGTHQSAATVASMLVMHIVAAAVTVYLLPVLTRKG